MIKILKESAAITKHIKQTSDDSKLNLYSVMDGALTFTHVHLFVTGIYFTLGGEIYGNNSIVRLCSIGEGEDHALICRTDKIKCCGTSPDRFGEFYYPNGLQVPVLRAGQNFYRNRGDQLIRLNRRGGGYLSNRTVSL